MHSTLVKCELLLPFKDLRVCIFRKFSSFHALFVLLGYASFVCCGELDREAGSVLPIGFEISGVQKGNYLVSQNGVFEFGFFEGSEISDGLVVGVRYSLGTSRDVNLVVWTVGGGLRVSENSTLRLEMDGKLVLYENPSGVVVWKSNTSYSLGVQKAVLLDTGDLVLMDVNDDVVWESFGSPTSTLLPGQSLHFPQTLRAPSSESIFSYYAFLIKSSGELALVWEHNVTYWRPYLSSGTGGRKEARFDSFGVLRVVDDGNKTLWSASSQDYGDSSVMLRHVRIGSDGNLRIYSWDKELHSWRVGWQAVRDQCSVFGFCGLHSLCEYNSTAPVCNCLFQDTLYWNVGDTEIDTSTSGCKKMVDLANCKTNTSMVSLKHTFLYGVYPPEDVHMMLSEEACKEYCSGDTLCIAVTSINDGSGVCTIKRTSFISGYRNPSVPATSYLKTCSVPQAVSANGVNPHGYAKPLPKLTKAVNGHNGDSKGFVGSIAIIILVTVSGFLTVEVFVFWVIYRRRQNDSQTRIAIVKDAEMNPYYSALVRLSFEEVKELTDNFQYRLGRSVFKGTLPNRTHIVAKELSNLVVSEKDFLVAVSTLGGTFHRNLVALKGFSFEVTHKFVLYEYVPNGSLYQWLIMEDQSKHSWRKRLEIALGVARALMYLHMECQTCIAHGNLRLENVLLDENLMPKVAGYGVRNLLQKESASTSETPPERDIYMFGEMLLQIVTCRRDIQGEDLHNLVQKLQDELKSQDNDELEEIERVVRIAIWCKQNQSFLRPSISEVIKVLEGTLSVDRPPRLD